MRGTVLTLLCAITVAQGRELFIGNRGLCTCNPSDSYEICANWDLEDIVIAHERCDKFYKCAYGKPVPYCCPRGTVFNIEKEDCDWPSNVECEDRVLVSNDDNECLQINDNEDNEDSGVVGPCNCDPSEAPSICKAPESDNVQIAHEYCNHFYVCSNGEPIAMRCGPNTLYNPYTQKCDWAYNVECGDRIIPEDDGSDENNDNGEDDGDDDQKPCNCNPAEAPQICAAEGSDGILVAHEYCHKFYICNHGQPLPVACPPKTLYNPYTQKCDWPRNVDCGDRICLCENGEGSEECDGGDNDGGDGGDCGSNPSQAPDICAQDGSNGVLVAHENCNQFYICDNGKPVAMNCPKPLLYNPCTEQCDWSYNVTCGDRIIPEDKDDDEIEDGDTDCQGTPNLPVEICAGSNSNGLLVEDESKCNRFYMCSGGRPILLSCPSNMLFNPKIGACDVASNVDCGDRLIPDTDNGQCPCKNTPAACASTEVHGMQIPHENCNQFYVCIHGSALIQTCPQGLFFEPRKQACEWPIFVSCANRTMPRLF